MAVILTPPSALSLLVISTRAPSKETFFRYLHVNSGDRDWGLFVTTAGFGTTPPHPPTYPMATHPSAYHFEWERGRILHEFVLIYTVAGEGIFESASAGVQPIKTGTLYMLFPGEWHRYRPNPATGWNEYWIGFDGQVPRQLLNRKAFSPKSPLFFPGLDPAWVELFERANRALEAEATGYHQVLSGITFDLLFRLHAIQCGEKRLSSLSDSVARKTKLLIAQRLAEKVDWHQLSSELGVSYSSMRHAFRQHTGISPHQYQMQLRLNKAKSLLRGTRDSVKEIADQVGFDCPFHFSHLFKSKTGLSPSLWRSN